MNVQNADNRQRLRMENITKRFPGVLALSGAHFDLHQGEVHLILGENGAGKSTLIKILSGVYHPDGGEIYIEGERVEIRNPHQAKKLGISTIYQEFSLIPQLTVAENIFLGREVASAGFKYLIDNRMMNRECQSLIDRLQLPLKPTRQVRSLNTAEKQLVEIARALSTESKVLIMDEPTSTLTSREIERLFEMVRQLKREGVGIIYISHRLEEAKMIGDRATVLREGKYIKTVPVGETDLHELISLMVGEEIKERFPKKAVQKGEEVLRVENLTNLPHFQDVSFSLHRGEVLGLAGLLGSGKERILRSIFGLEPYQAGTIHIAGMPARILSCRDAISRGVSYLPSDRKEEGVLLRMTVRENITLSSLKNFSKFGMLTLVEESKTANEFRKKLNIRTPGIQTMAEYLSGGNQQKLIIAKSLCCQSRVFFFDEPTQGIDVGTKVEIYLLLNELVKQGAGVLLSSSELPELVGMCDRILAMYRGRIAAEFAAEEADQGKILRAIFGKGKEEGETGLENRCGGTRDG